MKKYFLLFLSIFLLSGCQKEMNNARNENNPVNSEGEQVNNESKPKPLVDATLTDEQIKEINDIMMYLPDDEIKYDKELQASSLDNQILLGIGLRGGKTKVAVENKVKDFFGINIKVKMEDYICPLSGGTHVMEKYDANTESFTNVEPGHGGNGVDVHREILNIKTDGEKYYVNVIKAFGYSFDVMEPYTLYRTLQDAENNQNPLINDLYVTDYCPNFPCNYTQIFKDYQSEFNTYTYVFALDEDNLYFIEYKINS